MPSNLINISLKDAKVFFRDVETSLDRGKEKALRRFGAFVRSDAKQSMKTSRGRMKTNSRGVRRRVHTPSRPGQPPKAIEGGIKRFVFFFVEKGGDNVTIGPLKLPRRVHGNLPTPGLHEHGGSGRVRFGGRFKSARYPQRPYMRPAFDKNLPKLSTIMKDMA